MAQDKRFKAALFVVGDLDESDQKQTYESILHRIDESDAEIIKGDSPAIDALVVVVLHGNSAREIVAAAEAADYPCIIWAARERWAWPSSSLAMGKLREDGRLVSLVYGQPEEEDAFRDFKIALRAAHAISELARSRIGVVGKLYPNLVSCVYDEKEITSFLGIGIDNISFRSVHEAIDAVDECEYREFVRHIQTRHAVQVEFPGRFERSIKLHLALKGIAGEKKISAYATECWSCFPREFGANPCFGFVEDSYLIACEGDVLLAITHIMARALTGVSSYAGDIYDIDRDRVLTLNHCGGFAASAAGQEQVIIQESPASGDAKCANPGMPSPNANGNGHAIEIAWKRLRTHAYGAWETHFLREPGADDGEGSD